MSEKWFYKELGWEELIEQADYSKDPLVWELAFRFQLMIDRNSELVEAYKKIFREEIRDKSLF